MVKILLASYPVESWERASIIAKLTEITAFYNAYSETVDSTRN